MGDTVRPAMASDLPALAALLDAARREAAPRRGGSLLLSGGGAGPPAVSRGAASATEELRGWMGRHRSRLVLCGLIDGVVLGLALGRIDAAPGSGRIGVVECCYVDAGARQVGIGGAMATAMVDWFFERGCSGADVPVLPGDRSSKQLWEAAGFSARLIVLHRPLG